MSKILFGIFMAYTIGIVLYVAFAPIIKHNLLEKKLKRNGIRTTAILIESEQTGGFYNSQPEIRVTLKITAKNGETWEAKTAEVFSVSKYHLLTPGTVFNILYNPNDKTEIVIIE